MKRPRTVLAVLAALAGAATAAPPSVQVAFVDPARFADVRNGYTQTSQARDFFLAGIARFIEERAAPRLADGEALEVEVTDVHLAGDYYADRPAATNVRIVREVTPARIDLAFRVTRGGTVVREGSRALRSTGYPSAFDPSDPLNYEKALIDAWLAADFPPR